MDPKAAYGTGPFRAEHLRDGDRYEISRGHAVFCSPRGGDHAATSGLGFQVLSADPLVDAAGVDVGYSSEPGQLRAPDVAIGNVPDRPGWVAGAPPLAVEYACPTQDEAELQARIADLLTAGTRWVWVVRLKAPRHVEVHTAGAPPAIAGPGATLTAPGVLQNPVPVQALWDRAVAHEVTLHNLLQRAGYRDLEDVREEGREAGREEGREAGREEQARLALLRVLQARFGEVPPSVAAVVAAAGLPALDGWLIDALNASSPTFLLDR